MQAHRPRPAARRAPLRFGSWIGGDRDGNPHVTAGGHRHACLLARWLAAGLYLREIDALRARAVDERRQRRAARARRRGREPYRALLRDVRERLSATLRAIEASARRRRRAATRRCRLRRPPPSSPSRSRLCHRSLEETGNGLLADGRLLDLLRRVAAFGVTLVRLDMRQDAARHTEALDAITRALGLGDYAEWTEAAAPARSCCRSSRAAGR